MTDQYTMHTSFTVHLTHELGDDGHDVEACIKYRVYPGRAATLEGPAEGASVCIQTIHLDGSATEAPAWVYAMAEADGALTNELLAWAADRDEHARDEAADHRRETLREDRA